MDEQKFAELKTAIAEYKATPRNAELTATFDFGILLTILPMILRLFVKDTAMLDIIMKVIELLTGLFSSQSGSQP